jgi:predicted phage replisome organizer
MAEISWIKLSVNIFDDEKIKLIRKMPEGDAMLLIRIQLLCLAGKTNDGGAVYIGQNMYYTDEMLATICDQPLNTVRLALQTFDKFGMIDLEDDGLIVIEKWEKHQNVEGMEKVREQNRIRKQRQREKEKQRAIESSHVTSRDSHATDKNRIDKNRIDKNRIDTNSTSTICTTLMEEWNKLDDNISKVTAISPNTTRYKLLKARINDYGQDGVVKAIKNISNSRFLQGYNDTGRTISFDWFVKPNNFIKVLEGNYADKNSQTPSERDIKKHVSPRENRSAISDREWEEMLRALDD